MGKIQAKQVIDTDFLTSSDFSGDASQVIGGDGIARDATFESLETIDFIDPLNNSSIHANWTKDIPDVSDPDPTIVEDSSKLAIGRSSGGLTLDWSGATYTAPSLYLSLEPYDFIAKVFVSNVTGAANSNAGGIVHYLDGTKSSYGRQQISYHSGTYRIHSVVGGSEEHNTSIISPTQNYAWLGIMRRANRIYYLASANGLDDEPSINEMTISREFDQGFAYNQNILALLIVVWGSQPITDTHFQKFSLKYETVSTRLRGYIGQGIDFHDNFNDGQIHDNWTITDPLGVCTINEDSEKLLVSHGGGTSLNWWNGIDFNAPSIDIPVEPLDFVAMVHISNVDLSSYNGAGMTLHIDGDRSKFFRVDLRGVGSQYNVTTARNSSSLALVNNVGQNNIWFAIMRRGYEIMLLYSLNAVGNQPSVDDMTIIETEPCSIFSYVKNIIALQSMSFGGGLPGMDIHFKKFSLVYNNISLYQNESNLVEQQFTTDGTETPGATVTFALNKVPSGDGIASTPSGYHLLVYRNGNKLGYAGSLADKLHYVYRPSVNEIDIMASGDEEEFEVVMLQGAQTAAEVRAGTFQWQYLGEDTEIGLAALACYQFDGTASELNDRTGNGYTLTVENGTRYYTTLGGKKALFFDGSMNLLGPDTDDLRLDREMTCEFVFQIHHFLLGSGPAQTFCEISGDTLGGEMPATNDLFCLCMDNSDHYVYNSEHGFGLDVDNIFDTKVFDGVHYVAVTRSSDGLTVKLYIDGVLIETFVAGTAPEKSTGSNCQRLCIGCNYTTGTHQYFEGAMSSLRISEAELTADQIANVYDQIKTTNIETPVALSLDQQGYTVEDNFSDSELHNRWTKVEPGSTTVVEGSDGLVITVPASAGVTPYVEMDLPAEMSSRNWIAQCHLYTTYTASDALAVALQIKGQGGGVEKYLSGYVALGGSKVIAMGDSAGSVSTAESGADDIWVRLRRFGDEIRFDYYPAAHTIDPDAGGYWREWDSSKTWYVTPKSGTFNYPVLYEKLRIYGSHWAGQPDFVLTVRHFKLRIF